MSPEEGTLTSVNSNRRDGVGRAWRSLDLIVVQQYDERVCAIEPIGVCGQIEPTLSNLRSGQGVHDNR
jgi:hypothetical protein